MAGKVALGETDPARGAAAGTTLTLQVRVVITDVERFVADPDHTGTLDGAVSFAPLGEPLATRSGRVQLFTHTSDPTVKLMTYRVTLERGGRTYCLDGAKSVRRGSVLRSWAATTTLPCRLHAGPDPSAPVAGAGILRLTPASFLVQLASFRSLNAATVGEKTKAFATFLRFFSAELIDSYVWRASGR